MHHKRRSRRSDSNFDLNWDNTSRERKLPIEDGPSNGKKHSKKGCPRNKGGTHDIVSNPAYARPTTRPWWERRDSWNPWKCSKCGKEFYRRATKTVPKPIDDRDPAHWMSSNITNRLAGLPCSCSTCKESRG